MDKHEEVKVTDLLTRQILLLSNWNKENSNFCPEQVRLNCETMAAFAETSTKIKMII